MQMHDERPTTSGEAAREVPRRHRRGRRRRPAAAGARTAAALTAAAVAALAAGAVVLTDGDDATADTAASAPATTAVAAGPGDRVPLSRTTGPSATPSPSATVSPSPSASASPAPSASRTAAAAPTPTPTPTRSRTATARAQKPSPARTASPKDGPVGPDPTLPGPRTTTQSTSEAEAMSLRLLNAERATVGLPPLKLRTDLSEFARGWARHMSTSGFGHSDSSDTDHLLTGGRTWIGENIVWWSDESMTAQEAAEKFQSMWRHSPGHYKGQTSTSFTEVGVGIYRDGSGWWGVHNFSDAR
ncbi:CAP domain-containing protein [Streptomyces sp. NPDC048001]|uniref:CAP domain-containing protein n=1 Tax=Streptomyces sp. NPDC048001 TaxID=3365498 RepID=UPI0037215670